MHIAFTPTLLVVRLKANSVIIRDELARRLGRLTPIYSRHRGEKFLRHRFLKRPLLPTKLKRQNHGGILCRAILRW